VWSKRYIGGRKREGWQLMRDDMETRQLRNQAEFNRAARWYLAAGAGVFLVVVALVVWIVLRVTS